MEDNTVCRPPTDYCVESEVAEANGSLHTKAGKSQRGIPIMDKLNEPIAYSYAQTKYGVRGRIKTSDQQALEAIPADRGTKDRRPDKF